MISGCISRILFLIFMLIVAVALAWILFLPGIARKAIESYTGYPARVEVVQLNPLFGTFSVEGLEIDNPGHYPLKDFISLRNLEIRVSPFTFLAGKVVIRTMKVDFARLTGVKNEEGQVNFEEFRRIVAPDLPTEREEPPREFLIRHLTLRVDTLNTIDYTASDPTLREFRVNIQREFENVENVAQVLAPLTREFARAGISLAADSIFGRLLPGTLWEEVRGAAEGNSGFLRDAGQRLRELFSSGEAEEAGNPD